MAATAFILAAGLGTRLRPLTDRLPKALVPVGGRPMLDWTLAHLRAHGHREVLVNAHHHADAIVAWAASREVQVIVEPTILGTGGGLKNAASRLAERFVVSNADVLSDVDLTALLKAVPSGGAAMALRVHGEGARHYGVVASDASGHVVELVNIARATPQGSVAHDTHFAGLHAMDRDALRLVPDGFACIVRSAYQQLVPARAVTALRHTGVWIDVGEPAAYLTANLGVLTTRLPLALSPMEGAAFAVTAGGSIGSRPPGLTVEGGVWVGPGASLGRNVRLRDTVIGAGARVPDDCTLERCVVWDGRQVPNGHWQDAIFHDGGYLHVPSLAGEA